MLCLLSLLLSFCSASALWAEQEWSVSFFSGYNAASLRSLNDKKLQDTTFIPPTLGSSPAIRGGPSVGVEVEWTVRPRLSLVAYTSYWEGNSRAIESGEANFQDFGLTPFQVDRTIRLSFNEYALRTRYNLFESEDRNRFYLEIGLFDQVRATFREDFSYEFDALNGKSLRNIRSRAVGKGGYIFEWGLGGDYFFNPWLSLHLNANYRTGKAISVIYKSYEHTFRGQDGIEAASGQSAFPDSGDTVTYIDGNFRKNLELELDGWQMNIGMRILF